MRQYFIVNGYYEDDKETLIEGYIMTNFNDVEVDGRYCEEDIHFFGISEGEIKEAVESGKSDIDGFVITSYKLD